MNCSLRLVLLLVALPLVSLFAIIEQAAAQVSQPSGWNVTGSLTGRLDIYTVDGDPAGAAFPFTGTHGFGELGVQFNRVASPYERIDGDIGLLVNGSDYRNPSDGFVLERFRLNWEKGDGGVPFRLTIGDFLGYTSIRTLQRPLRGTQIDIQPHLGGEMLHSIQLFSGFNAPDYNRIDNAIDFYAGASWLTSAPSGLRAAANLIYAHREAQGPVAAQDQFVASLAGEMPFPFGRQSLRLAGEIALFHGEHRQLLPDDMATDLGLYAQLAGQSADNRLNYGLRYSRYGENYRPNGSAIAPNRESIEGNLTWRTPRSLQLRGRVQQFRDRLESDNPIRTRVAGIAVSGPILHSVLPRLRLSSDFFLREQADRNGTFDQDSIAGRIGFTAPITADWNLRWGGGYRKSETRRPAGISRLETIDAHLRTDYRFALGQFRGRVSPGLLLRSTNGVGASNEIGPSLALSLSGEGHDLRADYRYLGRFRPEALANDLRTHTLNFVYSYATGRHQFGIDASINTRNPERVEGTESYRFGLFYRIRFDRQPASNSREAVRPSPAATEPAPSFLLRNFPTGIAIGTAMARLAALDIVADDSNANLITVETAVFQSLGNRQFLVLEHDGSTVQRAGILVEANTALGAENALRLAARVREELVREFGSPGLSFAGDTNSVIGAASTVDQWALPGGTLRLGFPARLDGQVLLEIQFGQPLPNVEGGRWGMDSYSP